MMKKKEVLVISEYFAPLNSIASIRFTKILKYLSKTKKYHFTVISRKSMDKYDSGMKKELQNMGEYVDVFYIDILDNFIDKLRKKQRQNFLTGFENDSADSERTVSAADYVRLWNWHHDYL